MGRHEMLRVMQPAAGICADINIIFTFHDLDNIIIVVATAAAAARSQQSAVRSLLQ
jgi:hypothetical protein